MAIKEQFRSVIQWEQPEQWQLFYKFTSEGDEIKNASKLILQPGQGCLFTYEGKLIDVFTQEGMYNLETDNKPFVTTVRKFMNFFESEHKVGLWFFRTAHIVNVRWGTRIPITYNDPVYSFPVNLRAYGNYSLQITDAAAFFTNIVAGQLDYYCADLQELFLSRITQPISNYLANAKFSYAEIDSHIVAIAQETQKQSEPVFEALGFKMIDFRIEGSSFDEATNKRIEEISDLQAEVHASKIAGVDFAELQKLKALRDAAKNEGMAGASMGMLAGMQMGQQIDPSQNTAPTDPASGVRKKLKQLKSLFEDDLISEADYNTKKQALLDSL